MCFNQINKLRDTEYSDGWDTECCFENICHQFPDLYMSSNSRWIYSTETATEGVLLKKCS